MNPPPACTPLSIAQRKQTIAWLASCLATAPVDVRPGLEAAVALLTQGELSRTDFNVYSRQLARALGLIASSERRRSGNPLAAAGTVPRPKARSAREQLAREIEQEEARSARYANLQRRQVAKTQRLKERLETMADETRNDDTSPTVTVDTPLEEIELSAAEQAEAAAEAAAFIKNLRRGKGADPTLQAPREALMSGSVVSIDEDSVYLEAELPAGTCEEQVVKTLTQTRQRYDFSVSVTRLELEVEKKIIVTADGQRQVVSGSTASFGPPRFSVTWQALATLAVLIGQFALPLNRLATMLSTSMKRFTAGGLSRMAHYVATRFLPVYLELADELADSAVFAGDDTSCRVVEVSSHFAREAKQTKSGEHARPPWTPYRNVEVAQQTYAFVSRMKEELLALREEGDREAMQSPLGEPSLSLLIGRELAFESARRDGQGTKRSLNTTVLTGRCADDDPLSTIVFYRSHLGSLGNLLEMLLHKRKARARKVTVQCDLSTTNLVTDPALTARFDVTLCGCTAHARRPFALYEDQDRMWAPHVLMLFSGLAMHEDSLSRRGRNRTNVLAVRQHHSRRLWDLIKEAAQEMVKVWTKATPLGAAARYIIKHFAELTAYLRDPRLEATNNLRERLLRTEKLIEKSSMFRRTIEGRAVLDILRTILQTAVAAGVPAHEYLIDVMRTSPDDIAAHPDRYTPRAWSKRHATKQPKARASRTGS